jgi:hypothetical protein
MTNPAKDVLIVEDDDSIRNLVALALARAVINKPCDVHELRELVKGCVDLRQGHDGSDAAATAGGLS